MRQHLSYCSQCLIILFVFCLIFAEQENMTFRPSALLRGLYVFTECLQSTILKRVPARTVLHPTTTIHNYITYYYRCYTTGNTPWSIGVTPKCRGVTPWSIPLRPQYIHFSVCTTFHPRKIKILKKFFQILNPNKKF